MLYLMAIRNRGNIYPGTDGKRSQSISEFEQQFDFIVCGARSAGCVVAARLAENPDVKVLLLEAGGDGDVAEVHDPARWPLNLGSERDSQFVSDPNQDLEERKIPPSMGKALGGGSAINVMAWSRGHQNDWDGYAKLVGDESLEI
jgi:choline dehydrogenase